MHLTVKFLGERCESRIDTLKACLTSLVHAQEPFTMGVCQVGCFPHPGRPRVLWIGVHEGSGKLLRLVDAIEEELANLGIERERRPFHPHITVARIKKPLSKGDLRRFQQQLEAAEDGILGLEAVREVILFRSDLHAEGPIYTEVRRFSLGQR